MDPIVSASRMDTDEVVPLADLRAWLVCLLESAWQASGYRRTKNPRIWSAHDLAILSAPRPPHAPDQSVAELADEDLMSPTVGRWEARVIAGASIRPGAVLGWIHQAGRALEVVAPEGARGAAAVIAEAGWVAYRAVLLQLGEGGVAEEAPPRSARDADVPDGVTVLRAEIEGTVFLRSEPDAPPFVADGCTVAAADTLALVEVMKTFSPVRAPIAGKIVRILVTDGQAIDRDAPLFWLEQ